MPFSFRGSWDWEKPFVLADGPNDDPDADQHPDAYESGPLAPGSYDVSQVMPLPSGWEQSDPSCSGYVQGREPERTQAEVYTDIKLDKDEVVTCVFTTTAPGQIVVQVHAAHLTCPQAWTSEPRGSTAMRRSRCAAAQFTTPARSTRVPTRCGGSALCRRVGRTKR